MRSRHAASRGSTRIAAGSRSFGPSAGRPAELVPGPVHRRRADVQRRDDQRDGRGSTAAAVRRSRRSRAPAPARRQAERDVGAERHCDAGRRRRPSAGSPRRRPSRRRGRRRWGSACRRGPAPSGRRGEGPGDEVESSAGTPAANGPDTVTVVAGAAVDGQAVGEVERDHLGVDEVVAVVADADDAQRPRQLRRALHDGHRQSPSTPSRERAAPTAATSSSSGPRRRVDAAAANCSGVTTPASERRSILRR